MTIAQAPDPGRLPLFFRIDIDTDAGDNLFLIKDPRCRLQLRPLLRSDVAPWHASTTRANALLVIGETAKAGRGSFTLQMPAEDIENTERGVRAAIKIIARRDEDFAAGLRLLADKQQFWPDRPAPAPRRAGVARAPYRAPITPRRFTHNLGAGPVEVLAPRFEVGDKLHLCDDPRRQFQIRPIHPDDYANGRMFSAHEWMVIVTVPGIVAIRVVMLDLPEDLKFNTPENAEAAWRLAVAIDPSLARQLAKVREMALANACALHRPMPPRFVRDLP